MPSSPVCSLTLRSDGEASLQIAAYLAGKLCAVFLNERFVRGVDREGNLSAFGQEAHFDGPVYQLVCHGSLIFAFSVVAVQQFSAILIGSGKVDYFPFSI